MLVDFALLIIFCLVQFHVSLVKTMKFDANSNGIDATKMRCQHIFYNLFVSLYIYPTARTRYRYLVRRMHEFVYLGVYFQAPCFSFQ